MYIRIYQNINTKNKKTCIKIVPTDRFACEAHQGTQQLKKATLFTLKEINKQKLKVKINFYASDENSHLRKIALPKFWFKQLYYSI